MVRRFANQVHQQVSRLMRAKYMKNEPAWYQAVLMYPPLPLPPKAPPSRTNYDNPSPETQIEPGKVAKLRKPKTRPLPIQYIEDDIRRQFFRDHPFEAFRPQTLVEGSRIESPHTVNGKEWTRLRQRGRNPTPETAVQFALNLHRHHNFSLSDAYVRAVAQFRSLRSEHHIASIYAVKEATTLGTAFDKSEIQKSFEKGMKALETFEQQEVIDDGELAARKRWKAIVERDLGNSEWTKGEEYVRLWKEGVRPDYSPALTQPVIEPQTQQTSNVSPEIITV